MGHLLIDAQPNAQKAELNVSGLSNGNYIVKVFVNETAKVKRLRSTVDSEYHGILKKRAASVARFFIRPCCFHHLPPDQSSTSAFNSKAQLWRHA
jgi:hypothetical protein